MNFLQTLGLSVVLGLILGLLMDVAGIEGSDKIIMYIISGIGMLFMGIGARREE